MKRYGTLFLLPVSPQQIKSPMYLVGAWAWTLLGVTLKVLVGELKSPLPLEKVQPFVFIYPLLWP
jgi:hypothetical protein